MGGGTRSGSDPPELAVPRLGPPPAAGHRPPRSEQQAACPLQPSSGNAVFGHDKHSTPAIEIYSAEREPACVRDRDRAPPEPPVSFGSGSAAYRRDGSYYRRNFQSQSRSWARALSMQPTSSPARKGFSNSSAPTRSTADRILASSAPVMNIAGVVIPSRRSWSRSSRPLMPGICTSTTKQLFPSGRASRKKAAPEA